MSQTPVDEGLRRSVRTNRLVLTVCAGGMVLLLGVLVSMADGTARDVVGLLGLAGVVLGTAIVALDAWVRLARPAPRLVTRHGTRATELRAAGAAYLALLLYAGGLTLIAISFLLAPSLESVAEGRRGSAWVYVVVVAAPALLVGAVVLLVRRDRILLTPEVLVVRRLGRERSLRWDAVRQVEPVPSNPGLVLRVASTSGSPLLVATRQLGVSLGDLAALVRHLAAHPRERAVLGTQAGAALTMIDDLRPDGGRP